jgi:hypothetical protein
MAQEVLFEANTYRRVIAGGIQTPRCNNSGEYHAVGSLHRSGSRDAGPRAPANQQFTKRAIK